MANNNNDKLVSVGGLTEFHDKSMEEVAVLLEDTLWKKAQVLSTAEKAQVKTNLGLPQEIYSKTEVNGLVDTPHQNYETVQATAQTTDATDVLPASEQATDTIYRVSNWDGSEYDVTCYSEYAWNGTQYVFLCVKSQIGEVFDISAYNNNAKYADLAAALGSNGANVPSTLRKGGMSVKYVQSSDSKYVQYRLKSTNFHTDTEDWEQSASLTALEEILIQLSAITEGMGILSAKANEWVNAATWADNLSWPAE